MSWPDKVREYCSRYNIETEYLSDTLDEPKVIPMIRGKAFEFTVFERLRDLLDASVWDVQKPSSNAQLETHDVDVLVIHRETNRKISIECKLAKKASCRVTGQKTKISVKCMRSRTLGESMIRTLAPRRGVSEAALRAHKDNYLPTDFDIVVTSIGNAFYQTDENEQFVFMPTEAQASFLANFPNKNLKDETFNALYVARAVEICAQARNGVRCGRKACTNKDNCGFIPNNPVIEFNTSSIVPTNNWHPVANIQALLLTCCGV